MTRWIRNPSVCGQSTVLVDLAGTRPGYHLFNAVRSAYHLAIAPRRQSRTSQALDRHALFDLPPVRSAAPTG